MSMTGIKFDDLPVLSDETIEKYQRAIKKGRRHFLDKIVLHNMKLVVHLAYQYRPPAGYSHDDLIMAGTPGLYSAARRWKKIKGASFGHYAAYHIKHGIRRFIQKNSNVVSVPYRYNDDVARAYREKHELEERLGCGIEFDDERLSAAALRSFSRICKRVDLDKPNDDGEYLELPQSETENIYGNEEYTVLRKLINDLDPRQREILLARFGFNQQDHIPTLEELGSQMHVTRERIRQLEMGALCKIKKKLEIYKKKYNLQIT
jgi:RNA polymerase sigma factor (sigma-70 family)